MSELIKFLRNSLASYKPAALELMAADKIKQQAKEIALLTATIVGDDRTVQQIKKPLLREIESLKAENEALTEANHRLNWAQDRAITLEAELAALKQTSEPVAWRWTVERTQTDGRTYKINCYCDADLEQILEGDEVPLYLAAPSQKEG